MLLSVSLALAVVVVVLGRRGGGVGSGLGREEARKGDSWSVGGWPGVVAGAGRCLLGAGERRSRR